MLETETLFCENTIPLLPYYGVASTTVDPKHPMWKGLKLKRAFGLATQTYQEVMQSLRDAGLIPHPPACRVCVTLKRGKKIRFGIEANCYADKEISARSRRSTRLFSPV